MNDADRQRILETFPDADLSIVKEILYFDGWQTYEECGGYLIFMGIDDTIQRCEYGYSCMADNTNYFEPVEIDEVEYRECKKLMDMASERSDF